MSFSGEREKLAEITFGEMVELFVAGRLMHDLV